MKKLFYLWILSFLAIFNVQLHAQDYQITFAVLGESEKPDCVVVENKTQNKKMTLNGNDVLHLVSSLTGIQKVGGEAGALKVYPNPMQENVTLEYYNTNEGKVSIEVYNIAGKVILTQTQSVPKGLNEYALSGLTRGTYIVNISSEHNKASAVIISRIETSGKPAVSLQSLKFGIKIDKVKALSSKDTFHIHDRGIGKEWISL
jgi:hypothetical protein